MTSLISCPHCSHQLHESAPSCPQCGAPRTGNETTTPATYAQVPWYRKRWFAVASVLLFMPLFLIVAFTGEIYFVKNGELKTIPKHTKFVILAVFIALVLVRMRD